MCHSLSLASRPNVDELFGSSFLCGQVPSRQSFTILCDSSRFVGYNLPRKTATDRFDELDEDQSFVDEGFKVRRGKRLPRGEFFQSFMLRKQTIEGVEDAHDGREKVQALWHTSRSVPRSEKHL